MILIKEGIDYKCKLFYASYNDTCKILLTGNPIQILQGLISVQKISALMKKFLPCIWVVVTWLAHWTSRWPAIVQHNPVWQHNVLNETPSIFPFAQISLKHRHFNFECASASIWHIQIISNTFFKTIKKNSGFTKRFSPWRPRGFVGNIVRSETQWLFGPKNCNSTI